MKTLHSPLLEVGACTRRRTPQTLCRAALGCGEVHVCLCLCGHDTDTHTRHTPTESQIHTETQSMAYSFCAAHDTGKTDTGTCCRAAASISGSSSPFFRLPHFSPMSALPPILWAQRKDALFITIDIADVKDQVITVEANRLTFRWGAAQGAVGGVGLFWMRDEGLPAAWPRARPLPPPLGVHACGAALGVCAPAPTAMAPSLSPPFRPRRCH